jgi:Siphovirus protein of unknown function (DUF859).
VAQIADVFSGRTQYTGYFTVDQGTQSVEGNYTDVSGYLDIIESPEWGSYSFTNSGYSVNINGQIINGNFGSYDFRGGTNSMRLWSGSVRIYHNPDGSASNLGFSFSISASGPLGSAAAAGTFSLTTIPRATQPTVSPASGNTGSTYTIGHTPASSSFAHDIYYSLDGGGSYGVIATDLPGTDTSTSWTPAHTLLPNSTSVTAIILLRTKSGAGGSTIGDKTVNLPLAVPESVVPTISSVAWADTQTSAPDIPTLMGGTGRFVQGWSKLKPTVTSAGAGGSTVTSVSVTQAGQTTLSGIAFGSPVGLSGAVPFTALATDSRNRNSATYANTVAVTAYNFPNLPTPLVVRTSDAAGNVPSPTGTYLAITPGASVSSLLFGGVQKNLLEWQVRTMPKGGAWTTKQAWTASGVSGTTWTTKYVIAGYASNTEWVVEVSIRDLFGKSGYNTASTVAVLTVPVSSESVFMDFDGNNGIGIGRYRSNGMLDVQGAIYQNAGQAVIDTASLAASLSIVSSTARNRNRIINGNFRTNQRRYASAASLASGAFGFDRWKANAASTTLTFTSAPQGQTITINASHGIQQVVERANIPAGTYVLSWVGTATARVYNVGAAAPAYAASPVVVALNGAADVMVEFTAVSTSKTVGQVQLEVGSTPSPYELISSSDELMACQRYYMEWAGGYGTSMGIWGFQQSDVVAIGHLTVGVPMRVSPTIAFNDLVWTDHTVFESTISGISVTSFSPAISPNFFRFLVNMASFGAARYPGGMYTRNFAGTGRLALSAEL